MPTNLRSRPIEGYITDNAGNVLRNAEVIIKEDTPSGSNILDTVKSDDDGYFISRPIKNGIYDIYESGVRIFRQYHSSHPTVIQCYQPGINNIPANLVQFNDYISSDIPTLDINAFRSYIQLEPETIDVQLYGHQFPLWNIDPQDVSLAANAHPFEKLRNIHQELSTSNQSRFTHTRYDVELFAPLYSQNSFHRRIRWAGIPGVTFYKDSKIVLPLDYYSIVPNQYNVSMTAYNSYTWSVWNSDNTLMEVVLDLRADSQRGFSMLSAGDILELQFYIHPSLGYAYSNIRFWGILYYKKSGTSSAPRLYLRMWKSSNASHDLQGTVDISSLISKVGDIKKIIAYQGMFSGIQNITQSTSEYYSVSENIYAQDKFVTFDSNGNRVTNQEIYNYSRA